ncbi:hypothetical protein B0H65DRAFT_441053 [Neurospora tetraspora]|uniref:Uncharacterized protein n=1 Tax=Neurospora tetraspora TaxID=94610 RepID=A0AAE0JGG7_9PEZI|nr:hypothetical protein B0H65DRAFT_441053 [Neurospora tetraspora]
MSLRFCISGLCASEVARPRSSTSSGSLAGWATKIGLFELETVITCVIMAGILGYMRVRSQQVMERSWNSSSAGLNGIGDIPLNAVITCYLWVKVGMQLWQIRIRLLPQN